jgi:predicted ester cyclase
VSVSGITILRVLDGKIIEGWTNEDMLGFLRQLGIVPGPEQA